MDTINFSLYEPFFHKTIIIGLSGGPDSVFLLRQLAAIQQEKHITIVAAHLNHEWRPTADRDEQFCKNLCKELNIPIETKKISELPTQNFNGSKEAHARAYRRFFFEMCKQKYTADYIVLGHHQDDQLETFFIRLVRGTTHAGIGGIKIIDGSYAHPLLSLSKQEIVSFLHNNNFVYMHDETNEQDIFLRNKIRKNIVPELQNIDTRAKSTILRYMEHSQQVHDFIVQQTHAEQEKMNSTLGIFIPRFLTLHPVLQEQILTNLVLEYKLPVSLQSSWFAECIRFLKTKKTNKHCVAPGWHLFIQKNHFRFQKELSK